MSEAPQLQPYRQARIPIRRPALGGLGMTARPLPPAETSLAWAFAYIERRSRAGYCGTIALSFRNGTLTLLRDERTFQPSEMFTEERRPAHGEPRD